MKILLILILIIIYVILTILFMFIFNKTNYKKIDDRCKFSGEGFDDNWELGECSIAFKIIPHVNNVLEIGGGSGKVSHIINKILSERNLEKKHIVVEPIGKETMKGNHIKTNKKNFGDKYTLVEKYCENMNMNDLKILEGPPDCLYSDCEGCLLKFFKTEIGKYVLKNVRYIVNEMDGFVINNTLDNELRKLWRDNGLKKIGEGYGCGVNCVTDIWKRS